MDTKGQAVSRYSALLSDTNFNFMPYFDKAVTEWLSRNMSDVLEEQPFACRYFIRDENHRQQVASIIPLTSEFNDLLIDLIKIVDKSNDTYGFDRLVKRDVNTLIADVKLADMLFEHAPKASFNSYAVISALSENNFNSFLERFNPRKFKIDDEYFQPFIKRLPPDTIKKFAIPYRDYHEIYYGNEIPRLISVVAQYIPFNDLGLITQYLDVNDWSNELFCMSCGMRNRREGFKTRSGYSLHRNQVCDKGNRFPNLTDILGKRLMARK